MILIEARHQTVLGLLETIVLFLDDHDLLGQVLVLAGEDVEVVVHLAELGLLKITDLLDLIIFLHKRLDLLLGIQELLRSILDMELILFVSAEVLSKLVLGS